MRKIKKRPLKAASKAKLYVTGGLKWEVGY